MFGRFATKLAIWLLENSRVRNEDRQLLTAAMLDRLGALPIRAKVVIDESGVYFDGKKLTLDAARQLHDGAKAMLKNFAYKVVREQVTYMAIKLGVHDNISPEQGLFAKAALWYMQEERDLYLQLAQLEAEEDSR